MTKLGLAGWVGGGGVGHCFLLPRLSQGSGACLVYELHCLALCLAHAGAQEMFAELKWKVNLLPTLSQPSV